MAALESGSSTTTPSERTPLSRTRIVDTAIALLSEADDISIRDLAARLDVSPMALYRHVDNKQDLLESVLNALLAECWRPTVPPEDWQEWTIEAADRLRGFLVGRPAALAVYLSRPVTTPVALERMAACLSVLQRGLRDEARADSAFAAVHSYTIGFAALESARESARSTFGMAPLLEGVDPVAISQLTTIASPDQFRAGLHFLLAGLADSD